MSRQITTWTTNDGREILIKDMETSHIVNAMDGLEKNMERGEAEDWSVAVMTDMEERYWALEDELKERGYDFDSAAEEVSQG
jgi:hypothetical protein